LESKILQGSIDYRGWQSSNSAKEFVQHTIMVNAGLRLSAAAAMKHAWIATTAAKLKLPNELVMSFDLFRVAPPLKRIALNCLAMKAPPVKFEKFFTTLDKTHSGSLTKAEFMEGFKNSGSSPEELEDLFGKLDVNRSGEIMYTEFLAATLEADGELEEGQLEEAFHMISKKSKFITKRSILNILGDVQNVAGGNGGGKQEPKHRTKRLIDEIFKNKDKYNYEDFAQLFEHGFDANRDMDAIIETSLNEEQLSALKEDDLVRHMATIRENED
jgi:EF-hand domain pair